MRELFDLGLTGADSLRLPPCWPQLLDLWDKYVSLLMSAADVTLWGPSQLSLTGSLAAHQCMSPA